MQAQQPMPIMTARIKHPQIPGLARLDHLIAQRYTVALLRRSAAQVQQLGKPILPQLKDALDQTQRMSGSGGALQQTKREQLRREANDSRVHEAQPQPLLLGLRDRGRKLLTKVLIDRSKVLRRDLGQTFAKAAVVGAVAGLLLISLFQQALGQIWMV